MTQHQSIGEEKRVRLWAHMSARVRIGVLAFAVLLSLGREATAQTPSSECSAGEVKIRFSHVVVPSGHPKGEAAERLAAAVNEQLDGRACMIVYPNSSLFSDDQVMKALLDGEVQMAAPSLSKLEPYTKKFRIFDMPFLFKDFDAVEWFQHSGPGQRLKRSLIPVGFWALAFWNNGMKQMSATRPLRMPTDAKGLTFRIQKSEVIARQFKALGAKTMGLPFKEVRTALADGRVNGQENTWSNILSKGFYEFQDGVTETNHGVIAYVVVTSDAFWKSLPTDLRRDLTSILLKITVETNDQARRIANEAREQLISRGVDVRILTPDERAAWISAMRPVWDRYADEIGADLIAAATSSNR